MGGVETLGADLRPGQALRAQDSGAQVSLNMRGRRRSRCGALLLALALMAPSMLFSACGDSDSDSAQAAQIAPPPSQGWAEPELQASPADSEESAGDWASAPPAAEAEPVAVAAPVADAPMEAPAIGRGRSSLRGLGGSIDDMLAGSAGPGRSRGRAQRRARPTPTPTGAHRGALGAPSSPGYGRLAAASPAAARPAAARPAMAQNGVLSSSFLGGSGAAARLDDLMDRGVLVDGERIRLAAFDELGRLPYPRPALNAVGLHAELERGLISQGRQTVHLQIALMGREVEAPPKPHMDVRLILDRSGSMSGEKWQQAIAAAHQLVDRLEPDDTLGLISYSSDASVDLMPGRRGDGRRAHAALNRLVPGGGTNIEAALATALRLAPERHRMNDVLLNVLVSDGQASIGRTDPQGLGNFARRAFDQQGVLTTSVGLGTDFDEATMMEIARAGSGSYHFVRRASDISTILQDELTERAQAIAQALRVRIELSDGVIARRVYGSQLLDARQEAVVRRTEIATDRRLAREMDIATDRQRDDQRGLRMHLPTFRRGDQHVILMELEVPAGTRTDQIAQISLDYKDLLSLSNRSEQVRVNAQRTSDAARAMASSNRTVQRTVLAFTAGESMQRASQLLGQGNFQEAQRVLSDRQAVLAAASARWHDDALGRDAAILNRYSQVLRSSWQGWDSGSQRTMAMAMNFYGGRRMR